MMKSFFIGNKEIRLPVVQGAVGASLSGSASAVANEGGIGVISSDGTGLIRENKTLNFTDNNHVWFRGIFCAFAGANASRAKKIRRVKEVIEKLKAGFEIAQQKVIISNL